MKVIVFLVGVATVLFMAGCEEEHEHHHHEGHGGSYEGAPVYPGYGHGEYQGYPDYSHHRD
jgi:hypothetical protein